MHGKGERSRSATHERVLARHGRSFHFASRFLSRKHATRAARLYAFCRDVDDLADLGDPETATRRLTRIERDLAYDGRADPLVADFLDLAEETGLQVSAARELVAGVRSDIGRVEIADVDELLRYSYRVAGTVGLMMCAVLDAHDPRAQPFAIDLGIAMQLTNMARDVMEDARSGRRYLPGVWVDHAPPEEIATGAKRLRAPVCAAVRRLLLLADAYYESGEAGLIHLPRRARLSIRIAARIYRAIGEELERRSFAPWPDRAVVPRARKLLIASGALLEFGRGSRAPAEHGASLHVALTGLPGANPPHCLRWTAR